MGRGSGHQLSEAWEDQHFMHCCQIRRISENLEDMEQDLWTIFSIWRIWDSGGKSYQLSLFPAVHLDHMCFHVAFLCKHPQTDRTPGLSAMHCEMAIKRRRGLKWLATSLALLVRIPSITWKSDTTFQPVKVAIVNLLKIWTIPHGKANIS